MGTIHHLLHYLHEHPEAVADVAFALKCAGQVVRLLSPSRDCHRRR